MQLEVAYATRYRYTRHVSEGLTALRLRPRSRHGLTVAQSRVVFAPGKLVQSYIDGWGTQVDLIETHEPHASFRFELRASVETEPREEDIAPSDDEFIMYSNDSARVRTGAVSALGWHLPGAHTTWTAIESALAWMPQRFAYDVGATDAESTMEDVIAAGAGVCQDFSHIFLALVRGWGWCARYVSGYFFSADARLQDRIEADAMHAWVEVYRPGTGWIGLDATAGQYADDRYVAVGYGRDYDDVRPVRGVIFGNARQSQTAKLQMVQADR